MKDRITCKEYCSLWDDYDRDCDMYGEHHPSPRFCSYFRAKHPELFSNQASEEIAEGDTE